jgi:conjugal transfer pilus assembly protein TraK
VPPDIRVEETHGTLPLWNEARFSRVRQYEGRSLVGEKYLLQNISDAPMVLAEQEFDREQGSVVGIAVEHHNLRPGESTSVYVIRRGETP